MAPTMKGTKLQISTSGNANENSINTDGKTPVSEIYFSPVDIDKMHIELSSPVTTPPLTPTQATFNRPNTAQNPTISAPSRCEKSKSSTEKTLALTPIQLEHLITALVNAPLIQSDIHRQWWHPQSSAVSLLSSLDDLLVQDSQSVASLASTSSTNTTNAGIYSQPNSQFCNAYCTPTGNRRDSARELESVISSSSDAATESPPSVESMPPPTLSGIALTDAKANGSPIRFVSKGYHIGTNVLHVGQCSYLNVPYGTTVDCGLRVESSKDSPYGKVVFYVVSQVLLRQTGEKAYLLVADIDVTDSFMQAALTELIELLDKKGVKYDHVRVASSIDKTNRPPSTASSIDWCVLGDAIESCHTAHDVVEIAIKVFPTLRWETCQKETLALLHQLGKIKTQYQDFVVLEGREFHPNGIPSRVSMPWISQHLDRTMGDPHCRGALRILRERLVSIVAKRFTDEQQFTAEMGLDDEEGMVFLCVPLVAALDQPASAWACFLKNKEMK